MKTKFDNLVDWVLQEGPVPPSEIKYRGPSPMSGWDNPIHAYTWRSHGRGPTAPPDYQGAKEMKSYNNFYDEITGARRQQLQQHYELLRKMKKELEKMIPGMNPNAI